MRRVLAGSSPPEAYEDAVVAELDSRGFRWFPDHAHEALFDAHRNEAQ